MMQRAVGLRESLEGHLQRCREAVFLLRTRNFALLRTRNFANVRYWHFANIPALPVYSFRALPFFPELRGYS